MKVLLRISIIIRGLCGVENTCQTLLSMLSEYDNEYTNPLAHRVTCLAAFNLCFRSEFKFSPGSPLPFILQALIKKVSVEI